MKVLGIALVIALGLSAADPPPAGADGRGRHFRGDFHGSRRFQGQHHNHGFRHHGFKHHGFGHHGFVHRPHFPVFVGPSVVFTPPVFVAPPVVYAPPPVYASPPLYAPPPPAYAAPPPPPSVPRVVEFPGGRYELRGDGVYTPYQWVWIPNPPSAPPPPPPPAAPPAPPDGAPQPGARRPAAQTAMLFRWTDDQGVTTWTDSLEKVPARYRGQAGLSTP